MQAKFDKYSGKPLPVIFDGDSITNRWETTGKAVWAERFAEIAADFGIEGDRNEQVLWRLGKGQVDGMDPKLVVLRCHRGPSRQERRAYIEVRAGQVE